MQATSSPSLLLWGLAWAGKPEWNFIVYGCAFCFVVCQTSYGFFIVKNWDFLHLAFWSDSELCLWPSAVEHEWEVSGGSKSSVPVICISNFPFPTEVGRIETMGKCGAGIYPEQEWAVLGVWNWGLLPLLLFSFPSVSTAFLNPTHSEERLLEICDWCTVSTAAGLWVQLLGWVQ